MSFDDEENDKINWVNQYVIEKNLSVILKTFDYVIMDGSFLYYTDISDILKRLVDTTDIKSVIYAFKTSLEIWNSLNDQKTIFRANLKSLDYIKKKTKNTDLEILLKESGLFK